MKALVTGGAGFIGSHLCEALLDLGFSVTAVDNFATASKSNIRHLLKTHRSFKFYKGSVMNPALMERLIRSCDIVYHLAAAVGIIYILDHPIDSILTNVKGTEIVLKLASKYRKKVLITSSSEVYGKQPPSPIREEDDRILGSTSTSRWSYSDSKATDEFLALAYATEKKLPVVIVRLFNVVGPRQVGNYGMVLPRFIEEALSNKPITVFGDGSQIRSFCYVTDAVRAIVDLSLSEKACGKTFNIGSDESLSIKQLAYKIKQKTRSRSKIVYISYEKFYGEHFEDVTFRAPDLSRIRATIRYQSRYGIDQIIDETVAYFQRRTEKRK
ncbi:MAG: nucleoside-diphosphate sugar epimerase [Omnitrophica bacterium RIFCSPHIGHO2_02_FULL_46_11]|nr:MAG: nucleoside-diphosphate sugar epimerase [Omnitrophica bacterium RIFCSPHIGHO2_02_FULL_46_11]